jgi:hypothetical protein
MQAKLDFLLPLSDTSAELLQVGGKSTSLVRLACPRLLVFTSLRAPIADSTRSMGCVSR